MKNGVQYVDKIAGAIVNTLQNEGVQQSLDDFVEPLESVFSDYYVPNIRRGRVRMPKNYRLTEAVAIFAFEPGEKLIIDDDFQTPTPFQTATMKEQLDEWFGQKSTDKLKLMLDGLIMTEQVDTSKIDPNAAGFMINAEATQRHVARDKIRKDRILWCQSRPVIALVNFAGLSPLSRSTAALHEGQHAVQSMQNPIRGFEEGDDTFDYTCELEAYHVGSRFQTAAKKIVGGVFEGQSPHEASDIVERLRQTYAGKRNPFQASPALRKALDDLGISIQAAVDNRGANL